MEKRENKCEQLGLLKIMMGLIPLISLVVVFTLELMKIVSEN